MNPLPVGDATLEILTGDLTTLEGDAIVNAAYPPDQASRTVAEFCRERATTVKRVIFCCFGEEITRAYREALDELAPQM